MISVLPHSVVMEMAVLILAPELFAIVSGPGALRQLLAALLSCDKGSSSPLQHKHLDLEASDGCMNDLLCSGALFGVLVE